MKVRPRTFPGAALCLADFESGLFRLNEETGDFLPEPDLVEKSVTVAVDRARGRTFLLHYFEGVRIQREGRTEAIDLHDLDYMRDLLLDERNGDVWVAGWKGFVRLRESQGRWTREYWRVGPALAPRPKGPPPPPPPPRPKRTPY